MFHGFREGAIRKLLEFATHSLLMPVLLVISNVTYLTLEFLLQTKFNLHFRFFQNLTVNASMVILNDFFYLKVARFSAISMSLHSLNTIHTSSARAYFAGTKTHNGLCQKSIAHNLTERHASFACYVDVEWAIITLFKFYAY